LKLCFQLVLGLILVPALRNAALAQSAATPLTLQQAVTIALEKNPLHKAALAETRAATADVRAARSLLLPRVSFSETATRGNDPVYVFGSKLRQQRFTTADFALNTLNTPPPLGNFGTRFGGTWNLFDSLASWRGINRAKQMGEAAGYQLDRTQQEIVLRVIRFYYEVLLVDRKLDVSEQSAKTALSIKDRSQVRFDSGLVVESDLLAAQVRLATRQQDVIQERNNVEMARAELNTAMGMPVASSFGFPEVLAERSLPVARLEDWEKLALAKRPDLKRIAAEEAAQHQSVSIAKSSFGPRVNAFASWELDNPTLAAGGGGSNWMGGIEMQFDIFQGGAKRAELFRQRALEDKITALMQAASDAVRLEVRRAYYDVDASRQLVEVARVAIAQAQESLRINRDRYDSGLTTITDVLGAEEAARRSQSDYWEAVYRFYSSYAELELASGTLSAQSTVVMP
jgi:outer membrane protein